MNRHMFITESKSSIKWFTNELSAGQVYRIKPHLSSFYEFWPKCIEVIDYQAKYYDGIQPPIRPGIGYENSDHFPRIIYKDETGELSYMAMSAIDMYEQI